MSRRRVLQSDGRWTQGYRKTLAQRAPVAPLHERADWELSFKLPPLVTVGLPEHPMIGVQLCGPPGHTQIAGKDKQWVFRRAVEFIRRYVTGGYTVSAVLRRAAAVGPDNKPECLTVSIDVPRKGAAVITGHRLKVLVP